MRSTTAVAVLVAFVLAGFTAADPVPGLGDPDPRTRRQAVGRLKDLSGPVVLRALVDALADEDGSVRERAAGVLSTREADRDRATMTSLARRDARASVREELTRIISGWPGPEVLVALTASLRDRAPGVRTAAAWALGDRGGTTEVPALEALLRDGRSGPRIAALESLDRLDPGASPGRGLALLHDPDCEVRVAAVAVLSRRRAPGADRALVGALEDAHWSVRIAAARAISAAGLVDAIPDLIDALERETGRVREEVHRALGALTGVGLPDDPARWREWRSRTREDAPAPPQRPAAADDSARASVVTYHSIPVTSRAVTFVIDASRSMSRATPDGPSRRELALRELEATLRRLPSGTRFNVVLFGREITAWQDAARPICPAAIRDALRRARRVPAGGWTDLHGALLEAFGDRSVDTLFVLTDGAPSAGRYTTRTTLLAAIERLNRYRLVRIHTVGFAGEAVGRRWRGFLSDLARAHDGLHVAR